MKYFNLKFLLLFFALAVALPPAWADEVTVCDGTSGLSYLPVYGYNFDYSQHNQMIYPQSELSELPAGCYITSITFYPTSALAFKGADVTFSMANLEEAAPFQVDGYGYTTILDVTVEPVATFTPAGQTILTIELAEPFQYEGGDLLIDVTTPGKTYGDNSFNAKQLDDYYGLYSYSTTTKGTEYLPKLTIAYEAGELPPYKAKVSPSSIDFGKVAPNSSHTKSVTIKNTGGNAITPTLSGLDAPFSTTYTPATLAAGETATIPIVFNPTDAGTFNSTLHIGAVESEDIDLDVTLTGLAAYELTVCDGTTENSYLPVHGLYVDEYAQNNQMIYPAEMLQGINGKAITSMTFYLKSGINFATTATFSLKNLAANTPEYESTPVAIEGYTAVKTVEVVKNSSLSEWTITFDQPFVYNGGDLLLNVATDIGSYGTTYFYGVNQTTYQSCYTSNRSGSKTRTKFLPKLTFTFEDSGETPVVNVDAPVFNPEDGTTFEENLTVTLTCATAGANIQYSYNGEYFIDYSAPIVIEETTTIYAKAVLGTNESAVVQATYTKEAAPQPIGNEYVLVKDIADLAAGKHIIFVNKESAKAMSSTQNGNNRGATEITIASDVATATEATEIFTLEKDGDYWLFKASKTPGYIYAAGANSNNYLRTEEEADNKAQATIAIASDGVSNVTFNAGDRNTLMYNSGSGIFSCYAATSTQQPVYIFIEKSGDTPQPTQVATPTFNPAQGEYTEVQSVTIACATDGATIHYTTDGTEPTAESAVYSEAIAVGETMTIKAIAMKEGMTNSEIATATYTINIPSGEGTTFVKVTAADQLVAGKKYIIVSGSKALGVTPTGNFLSAIDVTGGNEVTVSDDGVAIMTLAGTLGHYTLALGDKYLHGVNSTSLGFGTSTEWAISDYNGTLDGYRVKHVDYNRAVRYAAGYNRFGNYSTTDDNSEYGWIYVEKPSGTAEPVDPEMSFGEMTAFTVYPEADFTAPTLTTNPADLPVTYSSTDEDVAVVDSATGEVVIGTKIGTTTITASFAGNDEYNAATATYTITVEARPFLMADPTTLTMTTTVGTSVEKKFTVMGENLKGNVTLTLNDENEVYSIDPATITVGAKADGEASEEITVTYNPTAVGTHNATITIASQDAEDVTITLNGTSTKPALSMALTPAEGTFTVGEDAKVYVTMQNGDENTMVTYKINNGTEQNYTEEGIVLPNTKAGTVTVDAFATDGEREATASATYTFEAAEAIVVTLNPAGGQYYVGEQVTVTVAAENTIGDYLVTYKINDGEEQDYDGTGIVITNDQMGTVNLEVTVADGYEHETGGTATGAYNFIVRPVVETPTFSPMPGSYTEAQTVTISCATEGATILYSTDGGNSWTTRNTVNISETTTLMAKATKEDGGYIPSEVATGKYTIIVETPLQPIEPINGYFSVTNNGNNKYVNVAGRKTINFTDAPDQMAGTVIRLETNEVGQVQTLRSQAADLQGYANRAMKYVPEIVQLVVDKLHAEGDGNLLGDEGLDAIMAKFDECFDYHLYVEEAEGGYRLYGKTPSMQPVVDFYREHTTQVETKLPMLEQFINDAIDKVLNKTNGSGSSILKHFSLHETWQRMGGTLTEPVDDASTMQFYREVLNDKDNVWSFAYETAMTYWERVKAHPRYPELKEQLGEFADYIEKIEDVHPDFKYYIVQQNGKIDYISQGNKDIQDNATRTIWTLNPRTDFKVNIPEENAIASEYAATLYTDFAYTLPEGVTAYKVTTVTAQGVAQLAALEGTIPAQTPVILKATTPGVKTLTLSMDATAAPTDNMLVGADYFIQEYNIRTPQVESLFNMVKDLLGESFYNNYVAKYEHLMLKTAGTVNNKYFWALSSDDLDKAVVMGENNEMTSVVRTLSTGEDGLGFYKLWSAPANQAFLATDKFNPVKLTIKGDIDRDGIVSINDVTALIDILLMLPERPYEVPYDYVAADFNETDGIEISDLSDLIEYLMTLPAVPVTPADPLVPQDD